MDQEQVTFFFFLIVKGAKDLAESLFSWRIQIALYSSSKRIL